jgi:hypothetical protein
MEGMLRRLLKLEKRRVDDASNLGRCEQMINVTPEGGGFEQGQGWGWGGGGRG